MVSLDDDFDAFLNLGQDRLRVAGEFGFGNVERSHSLMIHEGVLVIPLNYDRR